VSNFTDQFKPQRFYNECSALVLSPRGTPSCLVHGSLPTRNAILEGVEGVVQEPVRKRACKTRYRNAEEVWKAVESKKGTK